jgi:hypothetical protein
MHLPNMSYMEPDPGRSLLPPQTFRAPLFIIEGGTTNGLRGVYAGDSGWGLCDWLCPFPR